MFGFLFPLQAQNELVLHNPYRRGVGTGTGSARGPWCVGGCGGSSEMQNPPQHTAFTGRASLLPGLDPSDERVAAGRSSEAVHPWTTQRKAVPDVPEQKSQVVIAAYIFSFAFGVVRTPGSCLWSQGAMMYKPHTVRKGSTISTQEHLGRMRRAPQTG